MYQRGAGWGAEPCLRCALGRIVKNGRRGYYWTTVVYWRVGPAPQQPAWPQRQGRSAARSQWQWRAEEGLCWHPSGANHVCTQPRAYFAKRSPKHRKTKGSLCAEIA
jgi:hypothetical protein